jgi:hypothetical protein
VSAAPRRWLSVGALALLAALAARAADPPAKPAEPTPAPAAKPESRGLDSLKLPAGAVLVIVEKTRDALQMIPDGVLLTADQYRELMDQIDQLRRQLSAGKRAETPGVCRLSGRVEGDVVRLQAVFEFQTDRPRALVALGCQKAWPLAVTMDDGKLPVLPPPGDEGFVVQVDAPGTHKLTLELEVPLTGRGIKATERGFELGLPRAAVTTLDHFDAPGSVAEVQIRGRLDKVERLSRVEKAERLRSKNTQPRPVALGAIDTLEVSWKGPAPVQPGEPVLSADGQVRVRVEESQLTTDAELRLRALSGRPKQWLLRMPPDAQVEVKGQPADDPAAAVTLTDPKNNLWTVQVLKEPVPDPLRVGVRVRQPRSGKSPAAPLPVGPFLVLNAARQQGTIAVSAPADLRVRFRTHGEVSPRDVAEDSQRDPNTVAVFAYWNLPAPAKPSQPVAPPLELEVEAVKGVVETRLEQTLTLTDLGWRVATKIDVTPVRTGVERLDVEVPPDYEYDADRGASPAELVEEVEVKEADPQRRVAQIKLAQKQFRPFSVTLPGLYRLAGNAQQATLVLPRPVPRQTLYRGSQVTVAVPEGLELLSAREAGQEAVPADGRGGNATWRSDRAELRVELAWRQHRAELPVVIEVELTLAERLARVRQRLRLPAAPRQLALHASGPLPGVVPAAQGATLASRGVDGWTATLPEPAGKAQTITLEYSFPLPAERESRARRIAVPLLWPEQATRCETRVRAWAEPGAEPLLAGGTWEELPTEAVAGHDSLPGLVVRSTGLDVPLNLRLADAAASPLAGVVADRVLVQAQVAEGGYQRYRARFLLSRLSTRALDIEFPAPPPALKLTVLLDGKRPASDVQVVDDGGREAENGRVLRLPVEPALYQQRSVVLDVRYELGPGRAKGSGPVQTRLSPPRLRESAFVGRVRWHVDLPPGSLPLYPGDDATAEQRLGWRGWLPGPRPAVSGADLERWFAAGAEATPLGGEPDREPPAAEWGNGDGLVCWQHGLGPLRVVHVREQLWLLGCSLTVLVLGIVVYFTTLPRLVVAVLLVGLAAAAVAVGALWPGVMQAILFGSEPGLLGLALALGVHWLRQRRYHRQVVFMPGFTRLKAGSSLERSGSGSRPRGEPSTVDVPTAGSKQGS